MTLICAPAERPDSASYTPRTTRNSLIASMLGKESNVRLEPRSTLSAPSTCQLFSSRRLPLIWNVITLVPIGAVAPGKIWSALPESEAPGTKGTSCSGALRVDLQGVGFHAYRFIHGANFEREIYG